MTARLGKDGANRRPPQKPKKKERAGHLGEDETHQATGVGGCHWRHLAVRVE